MKTKSRPDRANKFTPAERRLIQERCGHYDRRGWTQTQIADKLTAELGRQVTQPMVCFYLKKVMEDYRANQQAGLLDDRARLRAHYQDIRRELWEQWERSKQDATSVSEEYAREREDDEDSGENVTYEGALALVKRIEAREGRLPSSPYISGILATLKAERELFGLDAPQRIDVDHSGTIGVNVSIDWGSMKGREQAPDPIAARRLELEQQRNGMYGFEPTPRTPEQTPAPNPDVQFFPPEQQDAEPEAKG